MTAAEAARVERRRLDAMLGVLFVAHGLVTTAIWAVPGVDVPFDPTHSWLIGDSSMVALVIGSAVGSAIAATGVGMVAGTAWWPRLAVVAGFAGLVLMTVWFDPWLVIGVMIDAAVLAVGLRALPDS